ncbi:putative pentatricopeptide repeat-containing protein At2g02150, partial [Morus notabilis]|uniref:putative pentatricopeptide repeat-containing protein At2g02150 n=1 Tax=Morus notabilis TaxID=981085 RepID=UPI000CED7E18
MGPAFTFAPKALRSRTHSALILWSSSSKRLFCKCNSQVRDSDSSLIIQKLLQEPKSRVKTTLDSHHFSTFSWQSLLSPLASSSSPDKARLVLEWRLEKLLNDNEKNCDPYSELISLCGNIRDLGLAMSICTSLEAHGIKLNSAIFNSLIHVCFSSGNVLTASSLFEIMKNTDDSFKPNSKTFDAFISGFSKLGNAGAMQAWHSAKRDAGLRCHVQNYESLIWGCIKSGNFEGTDRFYEEMVLTGLKPSMLILENMLEGLCKRRSTNRVKEFLKFAVEGGWKISEQMAEKLVALYTELGNVEEMEELLATLVESNHVSEVLSVVHCGIIRMQAASDRLDLVEYAVGRMLKHGSSFR